MAKADDYVGKIGFDFTGKNVLIYGATTGIGRSTAKDFAKAGAKVFVSGLGQDHGKSLVEEIKTAGNKNVEFIEADVTKDADIRMVMDKAVKAFGRIHCAFNNAGVSGPNKPMQEFTDKEYNMLLDVT